MEDGEEAKDIKMKFVGGKAKNSSKVARFKNIVVVRYPSQGGYDPLLHKTTL